MKKSIVLLFMVLSAFCLGQEPITYTEVILVDSSYTKDILFNSARAWINKNFVSSKDITQISDKETGELSVKAYLNYNPTQLGLATLKGKIWFSFNIYLKDAKYKYEITDFIHEGSPYHSYEYGVTPPTNLGLITTSYSYPYNIKLLASQKWYDKRWLEVKDVINTDIPLLIKDFKLSMNKKVNSDW